MGRLEARAALDRTAVQPGRGSYPASLYRHAERQLTSNSGHSVASSDGKSGRSGIGRLADAIVVIYTTDNALIGRVGFVDGFTISARYPPIGQPVLLAPSFDKLKMSGGQSAAVSTRPKPNDAVIPWDGRNHTPPARRRPIRRARSASLPARRRARARLCRSRVAARVCARGQYRGPRRAGWR